MTSFYVDSSIVATLLFEEENHKKYSSALQKGPLFSSALVEAEIYAAATREKISLELARSFIDPLSLVIPDRSLRAEYFKIFKTGYCRGADACHLATALYLDPSKENLVFVTVDKKQGLLAKELGFQIF